MAISRRNWNNLLIFAVAAMILLFQLMGRRSPPTGEPQAGRVLPPAAVVVALQLDSFRMERRGSGWISNVPALEERQLGAMIRAWQQARGEVIGSSWPEVPTSELRIWLADDAAEHRFRLYYSASQLLIQPVGGRVIELDAGQLPLLLPMETL